MMREKIQIKKIESKYIGDVITMTLESLDSILLIPSIYRGSGIKAFIKAEIENPFSAYEYFIALIDETVVGYCEFKNIEDDSMFLNMIVTHRNYKSKKIGATLLEYCLKYYLDLSKKKIVLDVSESNKLAYGWYQKIGFVKKDIVFLFRLLDSDSLNFEDNFKIVNYPQNLLLLSSYGFSLIHISMNGRQHAVGIIEKDLIFRSSNETAISSVLKTLKDRLNLQNVYLITQNEDQHNVEYLDKIIRMEMPI